MAEMDIGAKNFAGVAQGGKSGGDATGFGSGSSLALGQGADALAGTNSLALGDGGLAIAGSAGLGGGDVTDNTSIGSINIGS